VIGVADYQFVAMLAKETHGLCFAQGMCQKIAGHCRFREFF
jgi:hypothetical protein